MGFVWEEFWMNYGEIITLCAAAFTLVGVIFNLIKNNSLSKEAVARTEKAESVLTGGHATLSAEHAKLEARQSLVLERTADAKTIALRVQDALNATDKRLIETAAEQKVQYNSLSDAQKHLADSAANVGKFSAEFAKLAAENAALTAQFVDVRQKNLQLTAENAALRKELAQSRDPARDAWQEQTDEYEPEP